MKKINCKDGLSRKQELLARRLKDKLIEENEETLKLKEEYIRLWHNSDIPTFLEFLKIKDPIFYSAFKRIK